MNTTTTSQLTATRLWIFVLCASLVSVAGCSDDEANPMTSQEVGNASVSISVSKVAATGISRVELVVSASDMDEIREELSFEDDEATGVVVVPAGLSRLFTLNGYGETGVLLYSGSELANVVADSRVRVAIVMSLVSEEGTSVPGLSGTIEGLSFIRIRWALPTNWDSDLENDGLEIGLQFKDADENTIRWDTAIVSAEVRIWVATGASSENKKYQDPIFESDFLLSSSDDEPRVEYAALLPNISRDDLRPHGTDRVATDLVIEVEITLADGAMFADREV